MLTPLENEGDSRKTVESSPGAASRRTGKTGPRVRN
jgi:hypothetical protein